MFQRMFRGAPNDCWLNPTGRERFYSPVRSRTTVRKEQIYLSGPAEGGDVRTTRRPVLTAYH